MGSELQHLTEAERARIKALMASTDVRPSAQSSVTVYEIGKTGGLRPTKGDGSPRQSILLIPLVLREVRSYWARKGLGDAPDCRSIDGLKPLKQEGLEPQSETCAACPWNKFKTAEQGSGKKCKTKLVLFGMEVATDGSFLEPVAVRFSASNRAANEALAAADRASRAAGLPRFLSRWTLTTEIGKPTSKGGTEYLYVKPTFVGPAFTTPEEADSIISLTEEVSKQADSFLLGGASPDAE